MKIITWNCCRSFRNKARYILDQNPDILVIPECENPEKLQFNFSSQQPSDYFWHGDLQDKGLGVFTFKGLKIKLLDIHNPDFKYILPLSICKDEIAYTVFAVWAQKTPKHFHYTEHVWHALQHYQSLLGGEKIILAGDFNSNTFWDRPRDKINHSVIVEFLEQKNIISAYHHLHNQIQGNEKHHTFYMYFKEEQPYHLDYCFLSSDLIEKLVDVEVGDYKTWGKHSDHMPLTLIMK